MPPFNVNTHRIDPYKNFKFRVTWDNRPVAGLSKMSAVKRMTEVIEWREAGGPSIIRKMPGRTKFEPITLEAGLTHDRQFAEWADQVNNPQGDAAMSLVNYRKEVVVETEPNASSVSGLARRLRDLSGFEEELGARCGPNAARVANEALAYCLTLPGQDPGEWRKHVRALGIADRDRLLLELRRRSLGDQVRSEVDCPACGESSELAFLLSALPSKTESAVVAEVDLPAAGRVRLRPVTAGDQERLLDHGNGNLADVLALVATTASGEVLTREEIARFDEQTQSSLAEALDRANPDLDIRLNLRCHACGCELESPFDVEGFFCRIVQPGSDVDRGHSLDCADLSLERRGNPAVELAAASGLSKADRGGPRRRIDRAGVGR